MFQQHRLFNVGSRVRDQDQTLVQMCGQNPGPNFCYAGTSTGTRGVDEFGSGSELFDSDPESSIRSDAEIGWLPNSSLFA